MLLDGQLSGSGRAAKMLNKQVLRAEFLCGQALFEFQNLFVRFDPTDKGFIDAVCVHNNCCIAISMLHACMHNNCCIAASMYCAQYCCIDDHQ